MSVWLCIPSARPVEQAEKCLAFWRSKGYRLCIFREQERGPVQADILINALPYPGHPQASNLCIQTALREDSECHWVVTGGDDVYPDPEHDCTITEVECEWHFGDLGCNTFGVMQPTGDRWGDTPQARRQYGETCGAYIDRVAGSAWIGRAFCERTYGGRGPFWHEYRHMYADEELQDVATMHGAFWQRSDLMQFHDHWGRGPNGQPTDAHAIPEFLRAVNTPEAWRDARALFMARKAAGFPGARP